MSPASLPEQLSFRFCFPGPSSRPHLCPAPRISLGMIRKTPKGYVLLSKSSGKKLGGPYKTREQALKRERQVQFFKRRKAA